MNPWIALLRGINVGGNNILPMQQLKSMLVSMGCQNVQTYIQTGNVLLEHTESDPDKLALDIGQKIEQQYGFKISILVLHAAMFTQVIKQNPFKLAEVEPKSLHVFFLSEPSQAADLDELTKLKTTSEHFELTQQAFYLHAPDGIGRSKLAAKVEKCLGVPITARNWNTLQKLLSLLN
jgi:uncharacterized protein (DUF1697 family)